MENSIILYGNITITTPESKWIWKGFITQHEKKIGTFNYISTNTVNVGLGLSNIHFDGFHINQYGDEIQDHLFVLEFKPGLENNYIVVGHGENKISGFKMKGIYSNDSDVLVLCKNCFLIEKDEEIHLANTNSFQDRHLKRKYPFTVKVQTFDEIDALNNKLLLVIYNFMKQDMNAYFNSPFTPEELNISNPVMVYKFNDIITFIHQDKYVHDEAAFYSDTSSIFRNALQYHGPDSEVYQLADTFMTVLHKALNKDEWNTNIIQTLKDEMQRTKQLGKRCKQLNERLTKIADYLITKKNDLLEQDHNLLNTALENLRQNKPSSYEKIFKKIVDKGIPINPENQLELDGLEVDDPEYIQIKIWIQSQS